MDLRRLGKTGLFVSPIGLGTLSWGRDTDQLEAEQQLRLFLEAGGNLIDTAYTYGQGESEQVIGSLLANKIDRSQLILCSKAGVQTGVKNDPIVNTSRANLLNTLDASLKRLNTDYLDLWLVQHYDPYTPTAEVISALEFALRSGRVRYVGISNFPAWALAEYACELRNLRYELAATENEYSLLSRFAEANTIPAAQHFGTGFIAWSPLGRGVLTGKYRSSLPPDSRAAASHMRSFVQPYLHEKYTGIVEAVAAAADGLDWDPLQIALTWAKDAPGVNSILAGARNTKQLKPILAAADWKLPHQLRSALNDVSR